ncbi:MAG: hypothetical protein Q4F28_13965 [Eubacteriales bacterium]|nr:hypothetical protein [Eubacteriales bacterium]
MGEANQNVNRLLERKQIFADLWNGTMYGGRQVVQPEDLEWIPNEQGVVFVDHKEKRRTVQRYRDINMRVRKGARMAVLACENQERVHYAMPVRNMLYDALEYLRQLQEIETLRRERGELMDGDEFLSGIKKEDRIVPAVTMVLYWGRKEEWDGCKSLHELMGLDGDEEWIRELKEYIPDYKLNIVYANALEHPENFHTCLQHIFSMLKYNSDKKLLYEYAKQHREEIDQMDDVALTALFSMIGEQKRLAKILQSDNRSEGEEGKSMCKAIDDLIEDGREEGRAEGEFLALLKMTKKKLDAGKTIEAIAGELDEAVEVIRGISEEIQRVGEYDPKQIYLNWKAGQQAIR